MCQLFGLNSNAPTAVTFSLTGLAARGGRTDEHADGWGVAFHSEGGVQVFRDEQPASRSSLAHFLCRHPVRAHTVVAHIRKATRGDVRLDNCHPFRRAWAGRTWSFAHNGTLDGFDPPLPRDLQPRGTTDSERAFCNLMAVLRRRVSAPDSRRWTVMAPLLQEWARRVQDHGSFNFLFTDGQVLYAHCSTQLHLLHRQHPFSRVTLCDEEMSLDLSEDNGPEDRMALVATRPLTVDEPWVAMQPGELAVMEQGRRVQ